MTTEQVAPGFFLEAHFVRGLAPFVLQELRQHLGSRFTPVTSDDLNIIRFKFVDDLDVLAQVRTATAFYIGRHYPIPRPKALLGHQHFQCLLGQIALARHASPHKPFRSFRVEAAGVDSTVFRRLRQQIANATPLVDVPEDGELAIRVFPIDKAATQWTVLCRLTPRPLSARAWRVADFPGALNATIAAAMNLLSDPLPTDRYLNLMCGSGTLLIERLLLGHTQSAVGCDLSAPTLALAKQNIIAAGLANRITLLNDDATHLSLPSQSFDVVATDLPWGQLIGDHARNEVLYAHLLTEAARVASPGARLVLMTTEVRLLEELLQKQTDLWHMWKCIRLTFKKLRPRLYLLRRSAFSTGSRDDPPV